MIGFMQLNCTFAQLKLFLMMMVIKSIILILWGLCAMRIAPWSNTQNKRCCWSIKKYEVRRSILCVCRKRERERRPKVKRSWKSWKIGMVLCYTKPFAAYFLHRTSMLSVLAYAYMLIDTCRLTGADAISLSYSGCQTFRIIFRLL